MTSLSSNCSVFLGTYSYLSKTSFSLLESLEIEMWFLPKKQFNQRQFLKVSFMNKKNKNTIFNIHTGKLNY